MTQPNPILQANIPGLAIGDYESFAAQPPSIFNFQTITLHSPVASVVNSYAYQPGTPVARVDQWGTFFIGPNAMQIPDPGQGGSYKDVHSIFADFSYNLTDRRLHINMEFLAMINNPVNIGGGRYPGLDPYTAGWSQPTASFTLPGGPYPTGTISQTIQLSPTDALTGQPVTFQGNNQAIIKQGTHTAQVAYDTWDGQNLHITQVIYDNTPGVAFTNTTNVSDALGVGSPLFEIYSMPWNGVDDGLGRSRGGELYFRAREVPRPDSYDGGYHAAGAAILNTSNPGPNSSRTDRFMIDETGAAGLLGAGLTDIAVGSVVTRRFTIAAPTATMRRNTTVTGASFALPAATITVRDLVSTKFPAAGTVQIPSDAGTQTVAYTGIVTTSWGAHQLTGCTGGTGNVTSGATVTLIEATAPATSLPTTLYITDASQFSRETGHFIVNINGNLIAVTGGVDLTNRALLGCSYVSGANAPIYGNQTVNMDASSPSIMLGVKGQIAAGDHTIVTAQVIIGNTHGSGALPGIVFNGAGGATAEFYSPMTGNIRTPGSFTVDGDVNFGGKLGLFGAATVIQPIAGQGSNFTAGGGTGMTSTSTSTGGIGASAYSFPDIVWALKRIGALAQ